MTSEVKNVHNSGITAGAPPTKIIVDGEKPSPITNGAVDQIKKGKRRAPFGIFKAALFIMRRRPASTCQEKEKKTIKSSPQAVAPDEHQQAAAAPDHQRYRQDGNWKKLVGSVRPLHLQENLQSPTPSQEGLPPLPTIENLKDQAVAPRGRPSSASSAPSTVSCGKSQYASACNLHELDCNDDDYDDEEDPDEVFDAICGDDMIDAKADEFIAQFYHQMKIDQQQQQQRRVVRKAKQY